MAVGITLHLSGDSEGWTETYYLADDFVTQERAMRNLVALRTPILASPAYLDYAVFWDTDTPKLRQRVSIDHYEPYRSFWSPVPLPNQYVQADQMDAVVQLKVRGNYTTRRLWIAGIPQQISLLGDKQRPHYRLLTPRWLLVEKYRQAIRDFRDALLGGEVTLLVRERERPPDIDFYDLAGISLTDDGRYLLTTQAPHGFAAGQQVQVRTGLGNNLQRIRLVRRVCLPITATTFGLDRGPRSGGGPVDFTPPGTVEAVEWDYVRASAADDWIYLTTKRHGMIQPDRRGRRWSKRSC